MSGIHLALLGSSFGPGIPPIGAAYEGGFFTGQLNTGSVIYNLVVSPKSTGESFLQAKTTNTTTSGSASVFDGAANTAAQIAAGAAAHPAANFCNNLTIGGYSDWYFPSIAEMRVAYWNLKPSTTANATPGYGGNPYAVPPTPSYTTTVPGQTAVTDFRVGGSQAFDTAYIGGQYFTSTSDTAVAGQCWGIRFETGLQADNFTKSGTNNIRAFRRVLA